MKKQKRCIPALAVGLLAGTAASADSCRIYFGTSSKDADTGVYMARMDLQTGQLDEAARVSDTFQPGFLAIHPNGQFLYAISENKGLASSFRVEVDGTLTALNSRPVDGEGPCHISIDPTGRNLMVANYRGGSCSVLPIEPDGSLAAASAVLQHHGSSVHPKRQTAPHTHSINCNPSGRFAFVADLGLDQILCYQLDADTGTLTPNDPPFTATEPGGGPRHLTFHPSGTFVYANLEISNKAVAFQYDANHGTLTELQSLSTLPDDFTGKNTTSEILTTPDGRFLYVGNRGHDSLAIFAIDEQTGKLTARGYESTRGQTPRNFNIDPTGTFLLAANQKSGSVVVFKIDPQTGALTFAGSEIRVPAPICIRFYPEPK